mgnify:CR=1 FL=1|jgi:hypothetical protein
MDRRALIVIIMVAFSLAIGCSSTKVHIDYDRDADLDSYETYAWAEFESTSLIDDAPLMHNRIVRYINDKLQLGGMQKVEENPDLYFTYHTDSDEQIQLNTTTFGYGYGPGWYPDPYWGWGGPGFTTSTTRAYTYKQGTLIIDAWDAETNNLVWRGAVEGVVPENPQQAERMIYQSIDKMAKAWKSMVKSGK